MSHVLWGRHPQYAGGERIKLTAGTEGHCKREQTFREKGGFTDLGIEPLPLCEIIKRPKVGDTLDWAHGPGRVLEVSQNGRSVRILDRIDRRWTITREPGGHWVRTARAVTPPTPTQENVEAA